MFISSKEIVFSLSPPWENLSRKVKEEIKRNKNRDDKTLKKKVFQCLSSDLSKAPLLFAAKTFVKAKKVLKEGRCSKLHLIEEIFCKKFPCLKKSFEKQMRDAKESCQLLGLAAWLVASGKSELLIHSWERFDLLLEQKLALCCKIAKQKEFGIQALVRNFDKFGILEDINRVKDLKERLELLYEIANQEEWIAQALVENFDRLGLEKASAQERLILCSKIAKQGILPAFLLIKKFETFGLEKTSIQERLTLCSKIAKHAKLIKNELVKNFEKFGILEDIAQIKDLNECLLLCHEVALQGAWAEDVLVKNFEKLGILEAIAQIKDLKQCLLLCNEVALQGEWIAQALAISFGKLGIIEGVCHIEGLEKRLLFCHEIANLGEWMARRLVQNFGGLGLEKAGNQERLALYEKIACQGDEAAAELAKNFGKLGLEKASNQERLVLCKKIVIQGRRSAAALVQNFKGLGLGKISVQERLILCHEIASQGGMAAKKLVKNFGGLGLEKASVQERFSLCKKIVNQGDLAIKMLLYNFDKLGLETAGVEERFSLYHEISKQNGWEAASLAYYFCEIGIIEYVSRIEDLKGRLELSYKIAAQGGKAAAALAENFEKLKLTEASDEELLALFEAILSQGRLAAEVLAENFDKLGTEKIGIKGLLNLSRKIANQGGWEAKSLAEDFNKLGIIKQINRVENLKERLDLLHEIASQGEKAAASLVKDFEKLRIEKADAEELWSLCKNIVGQGALAATALAGNFFLLAERKKEKRQILLELLAPPISFRLHCQKKYEALGSSLGIAPLVSFLLKDEGSSVQSLEVKELENFLAKNKKLKEIFFPLLETIKQEKSEYICLQLYQWVAYAAGVLFEQEEARLDKILASGLLALILKHRVPTNRFAFIRQLSLIKDCDLITKEALEKKLHLTEKETVKSWSLLSWILLARLNQLGLERKDLESILIKINKIRAFKDTKQLSALASLLLQIIARKPYQKESLEKIANEILDILSDKNEKKKHFQTLENILKIFGKESFLECLSSTEDYQQFFLNKFRALFNVGEIENFSERYQETFGKFRDKEALYTYLSSVRRLFGSRRERVKEELDFFVRAVLDKSFAEVRYNVKINPHLKIVFAVAGIKEAWCRKEPLKRIEKTSLMSAQKVDYKDFFVKKILRDRHLDPKSFPQLCRYLEGESFDLEEVEDNPRIQFQRLAVALCKGEKTAEEFVKEVGKLKLFFGEFSNDLLALIPKKGSFKYTISESDDPCDLLLIGTEVKGSCQRVDGNPELNKCLISYLMNGEIRPIVVKEKERIVARSILRLMWDQEKRCPVLLLERVYSNFQEGVVEDAILDWARKKAKAMDIPLVSKEVGKGAPYLGKVSAEKGFAAYTYSDASGGIREGAFTVAFCHTV